jgi:predicted ATPase
VTEDQFDSAAIRTPDQRVRVFVSSTLAELAEERAAVARAVNALRLTSVMFELGARPHPPQELYRAYLAQSDIFVGLYWQRYGWVGPGMDVSGLEDEFNLSGSLPRLLYVKTPAPDREPGLTALIERLQTEATDSYRSFRTPRELSRLVRDDLAVLLSERFVAGSGAGANTAAAVGPSAPTPTGTAASTRRLRRSLPVATTSLVGRDEDIAQVLTLLETVDVRLVTLTGPGGIGKTRLAIAVAELLEDVFPSAITFVPLASVSDTRLVLPRIAAALGVAVEGTRSALDAVAEHIGEEPALLVLDNLEQVVGVAPELDDLLAACPGLKILATSRTVLRIRVEHEYPVSPLTVPAFPEDPSLEQLAALPAVQLFVARAQSVRRGFELDEDNARAVAEISRRLDGLPLAIELAAARTRLLDPAALLVRLGRNLDALGTGPVDLPERQRTLRATVEWSVGLLDEDERHILTTLGGFVDGWTIEAVTHVADLPEHRTLDLLDALAGHSLITITPTDAGPRFRMLEAVRSYAVELLDADPARANVQRRHAEYFQRFPEEVGWPHNGAEQIEWSDRMQAEEGNFGVAIRWFLDHDITPLPHMFRILRMYWQLRDRMAEGRAWVREVLPRAGELSELGRAELYLAAAVTAVETGDDAGAYAADEGIATLKGRIDDPYLDSATQLAVSWIRPISDDLEGALDAAASALEGFRQLDDPYMIATSVNTLGVIEMVTGRRDAARAHLAEVDAIGRKYGYAWLTSLAWSRLASLAVDQGRLDEARTLLHEAVDVDVGAELSTQALTFCLVAFAQLKLAEDDPRRAAVALGAASRLRSRAGLRVWPSSRRSEDELLARVQQALSPDEFARGFAESGAFTRRDALAFINAG